MGGSGITVSPYCLGAMMFGEWGNPDEAQCVSMIHTALAAGVNFVDVADTYSAGAAERIVGKALRGRRDDVVVGTKFHGPMGPDPNTGGSSRRWVVRAVEDSLRRLGTDYIDLYQIHRPDPDADIDETLGALSDLVRAGKVRAIGSSTFGAEQIVEAQWSAQARGHVRLRCEQAPYSILTRGVEAAVLPTCRRYGMGVTAWSPLRGGMLTGRYRRGVDTPPSPRKVLTRLTDPAAPGAVERRATVERLVELAADSGMSLTHMSVAFVLAHPAITSAVIGPRTPEQLADLLAGTDVVLTDDVLDRIDQIVRPGLNVPHWEVFGNNQNLRDPDRLRRPPDRRGA